jgi:anti-sigma regulatory factor (Ser/Thr protein kinase)
MHPVGAAGSEASPNDDEVFATIDLPHDARAAGIARNFVQENSDHLRPDLIEDAQLLVSEIVGNAVRHGRPDITLRVRLHPPGIGIAVIDTGETAPTLPDEPPPPTQPSGRGLLIVDALASAWGVAPNEPPPGKVVWFDLNPA